MARALALGVVVAFSDGAAAAQPRVLTVTIGNLDAPGFAAQAIRASVRGAGFSELALEIDRLTLAGRTWRRAKLACSDFVLTAARVACPRGMLDVGERIPLSFTYSIARRELNAELKPATDETWRVAGRFGRSPAGFQLTVQNARLQRLAQWMPAGVPPLTDGRASGTVALEGDRVEARLNLGGLAFADAKGLHAGENLAAAIEGRGVRRRGEWQWSASLTWLGGAVFWQPLYLAAKGHRLELEGTTSPALTRIERGRLAVPNVGSLAFSGAWNHSTGMATAFTASADRVRVAPFYETVLKPMLEGTALSALRTEGEVSFTLRGSGGAVEAVDLALDGVSFEDRQRRFAVFGVSGRVPWRRDAAGTGEIVVKGAEVLTVPVGAMRVPLRVRGTRVAVEAVRVPVFDGALVLRDFAALKAKEGWRWRLSGELEPVSMSQLTRALGLPVMQGSIAGAIPEVRYRSRTLTMDGALAMRVFDGTVSASNVQMIEPFGRAPRLHADLDMRGLDLELLTGTLDFGTITGRIDARVRGLELVAWEPVRFDARFESSPGRYPRRISQRAVQNISALGGAGAAAAIQRSFLRFFENFGYERLGLSCRLENGVCEMDGIERAPQGFVIVKGGGIPAISVIGYNRFVDWRELLERLKRVTQENVKPIVK